MAILEHLPAAPHQRELFDLMRQVEEKFGETPMMGMRQSRGEYMTMLRDLLTKDEFPPELRKPDPRVMIVD